MACTVKSYRSGYSLQQALMRVAGWMDLLSGLVVFGLRLGAMLRRILGHLIETVPVETVQ
jgi:hypothetical protein